MDNRKLSTTSTGKLSRKFKRVSEADDLPDITPELMSNLKDKWLIDETPDHLVHQFIQVLREHMDSINPYIVSVRAEQPLWNDYWSKLYEITLALDAAISDRDYSVPEKLKEQELIASENYNASEKNWEQAKENYANEIDRRKLEIKDIQNAIKLITEEKDMESLTKYNSQPEKVKPTQTSGIATFFHVIGITSSKASVEKSVSEDEKKLKHLRDKILLEYNDNLAFKEKSLKEYADRGAPTKPVQYRQAWNIARARILHHKLEFYRCLDKEAMLQCIRLYAMAFRAYYTIYSDNPLVDENNVKSSHLQPIAKISDQADMIAAKAKTLFQQMIVGMKNQMNHFYCLQPDRCGFTDYLDNFERIPDPAQRDAILYGKADEEALSAIFTEFETPQEAFQHTPGTP